MRAIKILVMLVLFGVICGVAVHTLKAPTPEPEAPTTLTLTVVQTPEEIAEQAAIQKILDESFVESVVLSWWRHPNQTTTIRGNSKSNGMFDGTYNWKTGELHIEFDKDRPLP